MKALLYRFLHWFTRPVSRWEWIAVIIFGILLLWGTWWGLYFIGAGYILMRAKSPPRGDK